MLQCHFLIFQSRSVIPQMPNWALKVCLICQAESFRTNIKSGKEGTENVETEVPGHLALLATTSQSSL